jgi:protease-4
MNEALLSNTIWLIDYEFGDKYRRLIQARLNNGLPIDDLLKPQANALSIMPLAAFDKELGFYRMDTDQGQVAIISLTGTMTKNGGLCSIGTAEIAKMISQAAKSDEFKAIIMLTNSPGGASDSVPVIERAILFAKEKKPVVAWVDQMAASAAMWAISACSHIMIDHGQTRLGSIGTYMMYENVQGALEKEGVKLEIIRAPQSTDKIKPNSYEPLDDDTKAEIKEMLREVQDEFMNSINSNLGLSLNETGKVYMGKKSIEIGLAHSQGTLSDAIDKALELANQQTSINYTMSKPSLFAKVFGEKAASWVASLGSEESASIEAKAAEFEANEAKLTQLSQENAALASNLASRDQRIQELQTQLQEANTTTSTMAQEVISLKAKLDAAPLGAATTVVGEQDRNRESEQANKEALSDVDLELMAKKQALKAQLQ